MVSPSRNGLTAASLAASGYVGIKRAFEREYGGWLSVFGEGHHPDPGQIYAGPLWETDRIAVKAYAAMGLLHAAIDAALQLRFEDKVQADQIERIDIDMPEAAYGHGGWQAVRPLQPIGAQMNVAYALGEGSEQSAPLGRAVIGGLFVATLTTLFVVPAVYSILSGHLKPKHQRDAEIAAAKSLHSSSSS
jgi:hypothetical protein